MGRHPKTVPFDRTTDRRDSGYYSTPDFIAQFITEKLLDLHPNGKNAIDPCVGKEELIVGLAQAGKQITGIDSIDFGQYQHCTFLHQDFITLYKNIQQPNLLHSNPIDFSQFDYWIANPPYNCHEVNYIQSRKAELKSVFADVGVHNMYSMFLSAMIDLAREGAILGFITLDSFLTSKAHRELRKKILDRTTLHYLLLCPTDLFLSQGAEVRTCILICQKGRNRNTKIQVCNRPKNTQEFRSILKQKDFTTTAVEEILLSNPKDHCEFILEVPEEIQLLFDRCPRLGERFPCITGISTGNDKQYLSDQSKPGFSIPFYKNPGRKKFFTAPDAYLCDDFLQVSRQVKNFMVRNVDRLYQPGIACSSMGVEFSACYLPPHSTYGVNANIICPESEIWWLLAYLNSRLVSYLVRGILIRTNMITSGYVSRIPVPEFDRSIKDQLAQLAQTAYIKAKNNETTNAEIAEISALTYENLQVSTLTRTLIAEFCLDIVKNT